MTTRFLMPVAAAAGAIVLATMSPALAADYTARLSLDVREDNPKYIAAQTFAELAAKKTDGAVEIQLFPNSLLGGEVETAEGIRLGSIQMAILTSSVLSQWIPQVQVDTSENPAFWTHGDDFARVLTEAMQRSQRIMPFGELVGVISDAGGPLDRPALRHAGAGRPRSHLRRVML